MIHSFVHIIHPLWLKLVNNKVQCFRYAQTEFSQFIQILILPVATSLPTENKISLLRYLEGSILSFNLN